MKRLCIVAVAAVAAIAFAGSALLPSSKPASAAAGPATLALGTPALAGGNVRIPIQIGDSGSGVVAYGGVTAVILWNPAEFTFSSFDQTGTVIPNIFCAPAAPEVSTTGPHPAGPTGVSTGENQGCLTTDAAGTSATGLMGAFVLTPTGAGVCSAIHLLTFNPPDNDPNGSSTQDTAANLGANQLNTYPIIDLTVDDTGATGCNPPALATATATSTATALPATSTPTATGTPKTLMTVTPTFTPTVTATAPAPTQPAGQTPAAPPPPPSGTTGGPSGGAGGAGTKITLPNTGSGAGAASFTAADLIVALAAAGLVLLGSGYAWRRRQARASWRR